MHPALSSGPLSAERAARHPIHPAISKLQNVRIPKPSMSPRPPTADANATQDWNDEMSGLFEWLGLAAMASQRLQANDRVDPYVAVYANPEPSFIGELTRIRWTGLLSPAFVRAVATCASTFQPTPSSNTFVGLTLHGTPHTPLLNPVRVPRPDGEDSVSLLLSPAVPPAKGKAAGRWAAVEAVGKWDSRFG
ncbi:hypothetical protein FA95DRAFT_7160 [Auriscalpium vulgare]|uniref:Uncharacterized protein n=1 Tax=Auriscalpium vulgare TaxID=40419 RepID=A0ACB8SD94_9AGAM|nr:hypothetical protein FA95DRAFT_7160 [Auriscalpium vulgare]